MNPRYRILRRFIVITLALAAYSRPGGIANAQPVRRGLPAPTESIFPDHPVEIPMRRFNRLPAVDATIDGRGPFRFIVDTGAAGVVLKNRLAQDLELKSPPGMPPGAAQVKIASPANKDIPATLVYIESLKLAEAEFRGLWTVATELPFGDEVDGVIGMNVFHKCLLTYDYPANQIRLAQGELPKANGRDILPFSTPGESGSHPSIEVEFEGEREPFLMDTGMRGWFSMPEQHARRLGIEAGPVAGRKAMFVGGSARLQLARLRDTAGLGQYSVRRPICFLSDENTGATMGTEMALGTLILEHFAVTFDARNNVVRFARDSLEPITPPAMRELGISLRMKDGRFEVWDVHPESHASSLGIIEGDIVHTINGRAAKDIYETEGWDALLQSANTVKLSFSTHDSESVRNVDVEILEMLPPAANHASEPGG